jgi:hypothetical protein
MYFFQALSLRQVKGDLLSNPRTQRKTLQGSVSFIHVVGSEALFSQVCMPGGLSDCLPACLPESLPACLFFRLSVYLSVCLSIYH